MANHLPVDAGQVARAAEEMIARHGDSALVEADKKIRASVSEGFDHVAETWKLIREAIRDAQQSDTMAERYKKALKKGVFLSE
jgi:hypothetical protein